MSARSESAWLGRTRRQKRADVQSRSNIRHKRSVPEPKPGGCPLNNQTEKPQGAQQVPLQATRKVKWVEPEEVEEPVLDGANISHALDQVGAWFEAQKRSSSARAESRSNVPVSFDT